ncbi:hypothetical protein BHQ15_10845 [Mycolicibacillus koreensis]|nr:hypothetical protein BHQ15_10845 [Mycolicibacillus koreensis]
MPGLAEIALGSAPLVGGALLGAAVGNLRGPDIRAGINADLDLLERLPAEQAARRAALQRTVDDRIDALIAAAEQRRALRGWALSYRGNWRDIVLFVCVVLFAVIWWHVDHSRPNWLALFVALLVLAGITAVYAARGVVRSVRAALDRRHPAAS